MSFIKFHVNCCPHMKMNPQYSTSNPMTSCILQSPRSAVWASSLSFALLLLLVLILLKNAFWTRCPLLKQIFKRFMKPRDISIKCVTWLVYKVTWQGDLQEKNIYSISSEIQWYEKADVSIRCRQILTLINSVRKNSRIFK